MSFPRTQDTDRPTFYRNIVAFWERVPQVWKSAVKATTFKDAVDELAKHFL